MSLVVLCGIPRSGKSTFAKELSTFITKKNKEEEEEKEKITTTTTRTNTSNSRTLKKKEKSFTPKIVSDDSIFQDEITQAYSGFQIEKQSRLRVKTEVERSVNTNTVLICDSLNYLKSFRYEQNCITRTFETEYCTVYFDIPLDVCLKRNAKTVSKDGEEKEKEKMNKKWDEDLLKEIHSKFEVPSERNKWEMPIFIVKENDSEKYKEIFNGIYDLTKNKTRCLRKRNLNIFPMSLSEGSLLTQINEVSEKIIKKIMELKSTALPGQMVSVYPNCNEKFKMKNRVTVGKLKKVRKQFLKVTELKPPEKFEEIPSLFVVFLNENMN